jgi:hypothetical protein
MWQYVYNGIKGWTCIYWLFLTSNTFLSFVINIACDLSKVIKEIESQMLLVTKILLQRPIENTYFSSSDFKY